MEESVPNMGGWFETAIIKIFVAACICLLHITKHIISNHWYRLFSCDFWHMQWYVVFTAPLFVLMSHMVAPY